ncbi:MAG: tyrosine-type recombinase/integrase [Gammaproteobacteria bacterium]
MLIDAIDTYLAVRRAGGFKLKGDELYLYSFARFAVGHGDTHVVARTAIAWAEQACSEPQRGNRLKAVTRFARFSRAVDSRHEIPPQGVFCAHRRRPTPYLFTDGEVQALMNQAAQLGPLGSLRPHTYSTLIGLLAATGLRISEALGLRFQDLTADGLVIRETKFRKSRLVPLHMTTRVALEQDLFKRTQLAALDDHLFVSRRRRALGPRVVYETFIQLLNAAGLPRQSGQPRPRLIDFRHSFASNALLTSPDGRHAIGRHMLALMTYLGHAHPSSTFWYLENSPQLVGDIAQACEQWVEENKP